MGSISLNFFVLLIEDTKKKKTKNISIYCNTIFLVSIFIFKEVKILCICAEKINK